MYCEYSEYLNQVYQPHMHVLNYVDIVGSSEHEFERH